MIDIADFAVEPVADVYGSTRPFRASAAPEYETRASMALLELDWNQYRNIQIQVAVGRDWE